MLPFLCHPDIYEINAHSVLIMDSWTLQQRIKLIIEWPIVINTSSKFVIVNIYPNASVIEKVNEETLSNHLCHEWKNI